MGANNHTVLGKLRCVNRDNDVILSFGVSVHSRRSTGARFDERAATENFSRRLFLDVSGGHKICTSIQQTINPLSDGDNLVGLHPSEAILQLLDKHRKQCLDMHRLDSSRKRLKEHALMPLGVY